MKFSIPADLQPEQLEKFTEDVLGDLAFTSESPTIQALVDSLLWGVENRDELRKIIAPTIARAWISWWAQNWDKRVEGSHGSSS